MNEAAVRERLMQAIGDIDIFDTHTHLVGSRLGAADFWEIAHYFWLFRELQAAGYPADAAELPEDKRMEAFLAAHRASKHTMMNKALTRIMRDLYGIELTDAASVRAADAAVKAAAVRMDWAQEVADRARVREFVVNHPDHAAFVGMRRNAVLVPRIDGRLVRWAEAMAGSPDPEQELEAVRRTLKELFRGYRESGCPGIMTTLGRMTEAANRTFALKAGITHDQAMVHVLHAICAAAEQHGLFVQLFVGVERSWGREPVPANDPERILKLTGLFDRYKGPFELVVASEINNLDVVQAAWNYPNVHTGGLWWFNFRSSTYQTVMQYRLEALAPVKSSLVVSDSRCMEWVYGKVWLIRTALAEFLADRVCAGWLDEEEALELARMWLYESAAKRYGIREK
ncbi:glucuronate isomerase [Paenibacillus sp. CC-CFT747]|nr:glucuronate isomerase [Paenibacillus sp. CC-CFT747]